MEPPEPPRSVASVALPFAPQNWFARVANRIVRLVDLITHPARHRAMVHALARSAFAPWRALQPWLPLKYLQPFHLAIGLTSDERAAIMIHHYDFLATRVPAGTLAAIVDQGLDLWRFDSAAGRIGVDLVFSHPTDNEGELSLILSLDGVRLSVCAFTFAPGSLIRRPDATIIAVTRIQGVRPEFTRMRAAMRAAAGLSASTIFMAVLAGIARRFDLSTMAGITAAAQVARVAAAGPVFPAVYDDLFARFGGRRATAAFYRIALPLCERPLDEISSNNRARRRAQRHLRSEVALSACRAFAADSTDGPAD